MILTSSKLPSEIEFCATHTVG